MLDWLKEILGENYSDEIDKKVSEQIGKGFVSRTDYNAKNESYKRLESELSQRDKQLEELKKVDADGLKEQIEKLQESNKTAKNEYEKQLQSLKFSHTLQNALTKAKARNVKAVTALLNQEELKLDGDKILGLDSQLETIKTENSYLFEDAKPIPQFSASTPGGSSTSMDAIRAAAGLKNDK